MFTPTIIDGHAAEVGPIYQCPQKRESLDPPQHAFVVRYNGRVEHVKCDDRGAAEQIRAALVSALTDGPAPMASEEPLREPTREQENAVALLALRYGSVTVSPVSSDGSITVKTTDEVIRLDEDGEPLRRVPLRAAR